MNYLESLKKVTNSKNKEVLVYLLICVVIAFISITYIFIEEDNVSNNELVITTESEIVTDAMELKLASILSEIDGISDVSVMITYEYGSVTTPVFNISEDTDEDSKSLDKEVVYNEEGSEKKALIESVKMPKVEGVIVVAKGASNAYMKSKIASAVSSITDVASYKVQVFEKKGE